MSLRATLSCGPLLLSDLKLEQDTESVSADHGITHRESTSSMSDLPASLRSMWHILFMSNFACTAQHVHTHYPLMSLFPPRNNAHLHLFPHNSNGI